MDALFIFSARYLVVLPVVILGIYVPMQPWSAQRRIFAFMVPSLILTYLVAVAFGYLYDDPRPFVVEHFTPLIPHDPDNGFPSDHALLVSAVAAIGTYLDRRLALVLWGIAAVVAAARVYVGLHHPVDVIGSIIISIAVAAAVHTFLPYGRHEEAV